MRNISAVIITFNEEKNIERCLNSLISVADEIIVMDSFSTDTTREICGKFDIKFLQHPFDGYIEQKNRAIDAAENDFILSLDADEALSPELKKSILEIAKIGIDDSYYFNRLNHYCGNPVRRTDWYPDRKTRLWNRTKGRWGGVNPHDKVILSKGVSEKFLKGDLLHFSFNSIEEHLNQSNKFSKISAEQLIIRRKKNLFLNLIFSPPFKFFKNYFIKLGILEGFTGFLISSFIAHETFLKYAKAIHRKRFSADKSV